MGDEADFASYAVARWPALVRTLVLLGAPPAQADALAQDALALCHPEFDRVRREGDLDVHVYQRLRQVWARQTRGAGAPGRSPDGAAPVPDAAGLDAAVLDPTVVDPEARVRLLGALLRALAGLSEQQRSVVVLRFVAELDPDQVAEVLGIPAAEVAARQSEALARVDPVGLAREFL